jgi:hypothetical protein
MSHQRELPSPFPAHEAKIGSIKNATNTRQQSQRSRVDKNAFLMFASIFTNQPTAFWRVDCKAERWRELRNVLQREVVIKHVFMYRGAPSAAIREKKHANGCNTDHYHTT